MKKLFFAGLLTAIVGGSVVAASLPSSVLEDPLEGIQQRPTTYKVTGTLMNRRNHVAIAGGMIILKDLTTGDQQSLPSDTQGGYTVVLQVDHNYTLQASASGYKTSEPVTFRANTNDPERVPMKVQDFRLSER
ncbi:carboxypeptidase regulator [Capnocytophaga gingivalis]|uniref:Carboxypeptidase regulator n=1 Tax=Capnocytophaga gingivalis TaxID=1017 RepID=A0A250FNH6_9FLAO|nr:carboxypeptidase-like regulatory domain-containing protein [Capnocytophaga gingivalis]ATA86670.1 carboxypeptidase regulator [Capnocytophaga gingivalis]